MLRVCSRGFSKFQKLCFDLKSLQFGLLWKFVYLLKGNSSGVRDRGGKVKWIWIEHGDCLFGYFWYDYLNILFLSIRITSGLIGKLILVLVLWSILLANIV